MSLLLADLFTSLWLRGLLGRAVRFGRATVRAAPAALLLALGLTAISPPADSQAADEAAKPGPPPLAEEQALMGALDVRSEERR